MAVEDVADARLLKLQIADFILIKVSEETRVHSTKILRRSVKFLGKIAKKRKEMI